MHVILIGYLHYRYFQEAQDCATALIEQVEAHRLRLDDWAPVYMNLLFLRLQAALGSREYATAKSYAQHIVSVVDTHPFLRGVYDTNRGAWENQLRVAGVNHTVK
jgi:hypothetical protein